MTKTRLLCACAISVLAVAASPAMAQTADDSADTTKDIVVTGSIIKGTPEDAALPVNVIGAADLEKQGSPSAVELLKALPTSSAVLGDANQFDSRSQGAEGIATANLRGLSPQRTLVLLNNRRLVTAGNGVPAVDINLIPAAAIGRIEVLKDGGATTYGSDAIAGVVNFITRTDQEGFRVAANYRFVQEHRRRHRRVDQLRPCRRRLPLPGRGQLQQARRTARARPRFRDQVVHHKPAGRLDRWR